jgi:hypothetical protein
MGVLKKFFQSLWGVTDPGLELTPPIDCEACRIARSAGKDACAIHRTHHDRNHPSGHDPNGIGPI